MSELNANEPDYGNWVSMKLLYVSGAVGVLLFSLSFVVLLLGLSFVFFMLLVGAVLSVFVCVYFVYARYKFSPRGGNVQTQIQELVLSRLDWDGEGRALDVGCGNAPFTIMMAKGFPKASVTGIDYWGGMWEYLKSICERNAEIEGVAARVNFRKASASALRARLWTFSETVEVFHDTCETIFKLMEKYEGFCFYAR